MVSSAPASSAPAAPASFWGRTVLGRPLWQALFLTLGTLALAEQINALYGPPGPDVESPFPWLPLDKLVHCCLFGGPVLFFRLARVRAWLLAALFFAHAVVSEIIQGVFLPRRSGDPLDALADSVGITLGLLAAQLIIRLRERRRAPGTPAR